MAPGQERAGQHCLKQFFFLGNHRQTSYHYSECTVISSAMTFLLSSFVGKEIASPSQRLVQALHPTTQSYGLATMGVISFIIPLEHAIPAEIEALLAADALV